MVPPLHKMTFENITIGINQGHPLQVQQGLDREKNVTALCVQSC